MPKTNWPEWWAWELELSAHVLKRMEDRRFNEVELRRMLEHASWFRDDIVTDRFIVAGRHAGQAWEVIVEPDAERPAARRHHGVSVRIGAL